MSNIAACCVCGAGYSQRSVRISNAGGFFCTCVVGTQSQKGCFAHVVELSEKKEVNGWGWAGLSRDVFAFGVIGYST